MIQCPICQVMNEDSASFCAECGQRFGSGEAPRPQQPRPSAPGGPPAMRGPGPGTGPGPVPGPGPQSAPGPVPGQPVPPAQTGTPGPAGKPKKTKVKLHSPMLGGPDEEDDFEDVRQRSQTDRKAPKRGGLRSPLLGAEDDDLDDFDDAPRGPKADKGKRKLRSPLLGDEDDDDEPVRRPPSGGAPHLRSPLLGDDDAPGPRSRPSEPRAGGRQRLHSPILGGDDFDDYDDYDDDDNDAEDPNVLRSPLLQAKRPKHDLPGHAQHPQSGFPGPETPAQQPAFPAPQPQAPQPYPQQAPSPPQQGFPPPQPAPLGTVEPPQLFQNAGPGQNQLPAPAPAPAPAPSPSPAPRPQMAANPLIVAKPAEPSPQPAGDVGPQDRRQNDRRRGSRDRRSFSNLVDDGPDDDFQGGSSGAPSGGTMAIMVTAFIGALFKVWYLVNLLTTYEFKQVQMMVFDQVATLVVFVGLIIFASSAKKG